MELTEQGSRAYGVRIRAIRPCLNPSKTMTINGVRITLAALAAEIHDCGAYLRRNFTLAELDEEDGSTPGTDCRLRVHGDGWQLLTGSADYDQDHRGSWGASSIPWGCTWKEAREIARDLMNECADHAADMAEPDTGRSFAVKTD